MRQLKETPARMVVDGQVAEFGAFKEPFREVNLLDVELELSGRRAPRALREMRLKEWEHFGIISEEYYFGMVILTRNSWVRPSSMPTIARPESFLNTSARRWVDRYV